MEPKDIPGRIAAVRDQLQRADETSDSRASIGAILIALDGILELIEATNKRVDGGYAYTDSISPDAY